MIRRPVLPRRSARLRLTLWYGGIVLLTGVTLLTLTYVLMSRSLRGDPGGVKAAIERQLARHVHEVTVPPPAGVGTDLGRTAGFPDGLPARMFQLDGPVVVALPDPGTTPVARASGQPDGLPPHARSAAPTTTAVPQPAKGVTSTVTAPPPALAAGSTATTLSPNAPVAKVVVSPTHPPVTQPAVAAPTATTPPEYVLTLPALQKRTIAQAMHQLVQQSGVALALLALVSLVIGWVMAGRILRPVKEITATARRLSERNLHERIGLQGPDDELRELADTFDAMLSRLDSAFALQRDFVANASHELRTPLTIIRTDLDVTMSDPDATMGDYQDMAATIHQATVRSERLIEALLTLARTDGPVEGCPIDLADVSGQVLDQLRPVISGAGLRVDATLASASVLGDRSLLERLIGNLLENAIRYNRLGGWLSIETGQAGDRARLLVANSGERLDQVEVPVLFQRFYRRDPSRSRATGGAGLGLSIVEAVARAHGGRLEATALSGGGLRIVTELPLVPKPAELVLNGPNKGGIKGLLTTPLSRVP